MVSASDVFNWLYDRPEKSATAEEFDQEFGPELWKGVVNNLIDKKYIVEDNGTYTLDFE